MMIPIIFIVLIIPSFIHSKTLLIEVDENDGGTPEMEDISIEDQKLDNIKGFLYVYMDVTGWGSFYN